MRRMPSTGRGKASKKERNDEALDRCAGNAGFAIERNGFERASFSWYNQGRKKRRPAMRKGDKRGHAIRRGS